MSARKVWTPYQDNALIILRNHRNIKKWSRISELLNTQFGIIGRNGKNCRQRYHNHLDTSIKRYVWSQSENQILIQAHHKMGNRWASIAKILPGRTDNCVKNHFYSQFRKAVRNVNHEMREYTKKSPIKTNFIHIIISVTESESRNGTVIDDQFRQIAEQLKSQILKYSLIDYKEGDLQSLSLISSLTEKFKKMNTYDIGPKKQKNMVNTNFINPSLEFENQEYSRHEQINKEIQNIEQQQKDQKYYPQAFNVEYLSLRGISDFLDRHLDQSENINLGFLNSEMQQQQSYDVNFFYEEDNIDIEGSRIEL